MALNFLLEHHEGVDQLLRARRAAGDVDIDGDYLVDWDQGVVVEDAGGGGAGTHRDSPLGFGHLLVEVADDGGHLLGDAPGNDHEVALPADARTQVGYLDG